MSLDFESLGLIMCPKCLAGITHRDINYHPCDEIRGKWLDGTFGQRELISERLESAHPTWFLISDYLN